MVIAMALGDLCWRRRLGACHIHSLLIRYMHPDIHDDIWAPHRALGDGTLGPGSSTLHTWAKVHHPGPYPGTHPSPPCSLSLLPRHRHTSTPYKHTHIHRHGRVLGRMCVPLYCGTLEGTFSTAAVAVAVAAAAASSSSPRTLTPNARADTHARIT